MNNTNWSNVEDAKDFPRVTAGGYNCFITAVEDVTDKEYLKFEYDIIDGEFKGYYRDLFASKMFWGGTFIKSYKEKAMPFFKAMLTSLENSNPKFTVAKFNNDPTKLLRLRLGLVLGEEEYLANDSTIKTRLYVHQIRSLSSIKDNDFEVPKLKKYVGKSASSNSFPTSQPQNFSGGDFEEFEEFGELSDSDLPY